MILRFQFNKECIKNIKRGCGILVSPFEYDENEHRIETSPRKFGNLKFGMGRPIRHGKVFGA